MSSFTARQSLLRALSQCGRRSWHELHSGLAHVTDNTDLVAGYSEHATDLGRLLHSVAEEMLRTLDRQGETQMPTEEAVAVMREVYAKSGVILPLAELDDLKFLTLRLAERTWQVDRLLRTPTGDLALEQRITVPLTCPDGVVRTLAVTPDALFAGSSMTVIGLDHKSGRATPKRPRSPQEGVPENVVRGIQYLSDQGHYQALAQGIGVLHLYPACERFIFRELWLRSGIVVEAILGREEFEHAREFVAIDLMKLERALDDPGSEVWKPRAGKWCARACTVAKSCPVAVEQRGRGAAEDQEAADALADSLVVLDAQRDQTKDALKSYFTEMGRGGVTSDNREMRFDQGKGGAFGMVPVEDRPPDEPDTLEADLEASLRVVGGPS